MAQLNSKPMEKALVTEVYDLFSQAKLAVESGNRTQAELLSDTAWTRVPEPKYGWDHTYMCLFMLVKTLRPIGCYDKAIDLIDGYLASEYYLDYQDGPYFWLGTLYYEKGELLKAYEYFERANKMSRGRCFVEEDPKYKQFFRTYKTTGVH